MSNFFRDSIAQRDAFNAGFAAYKNGATIDANPHHKRLKVHKEWEQGWRNAWHNSAEQKPPTEAR